MFFTLRKTSKTIRTLTKLATISDEISLKAVFSYIHLLTVSTKRFSRAPSCHSSSFSSSIPYRDWTPPPTTLHTFLVIILYLVFNTIIAGKYIFRVHLQSDPARAFFTVALHLRRHITISCDSLLAAVGFYYLQIQSTISRIPSFSCFSRSLSSPLIKRHTETRPIRFSTTTSYHFTTT